MRSGSGIILLLVGDNGCIREVNFDVRKADRAALCDIRNVVIDTTLPCKERIKSYIDQIGNPYCYVDDGVVVAIGYADTQVSLQDRLKSYVSSLG